MATLYGPNIPQFGNITLNTYLPWKSTTRYRTPANSAIMLIYTMNYGITSMTDEVTKVWRYTPATYSYSEVASIGKYAMVIVSLNAGDIIYANNPISIGGSSNDLNGIIMDWDAVEFTHWSSRYASKILYFTATERAANVTIHKGDGVNPPSLWYTSSVGYLAMGNVALTYGTSIETYVITSDYPIACSSGGTEGDCAAIYPATTEPLYGTRGGGGTPQGIGIVSARDNCTLTSYDSTGNVVTSGTINKGIISVIGFGTTNYGAPSIKIVANQPICAVSQADGDGGEMGECIPYTAFGRVFSTYHNRNDWAKFTSNVAANVVIYNTVGNVFANFTLAGNSITGVYDYYLSSGNSPLAGYVTVSDQPIHMVQEGPADDESIVYGHIAGNHVESIKNVDKTGEFYFQPKALSWGTHLGTTRQGFNGINNYLATNKTITANVTVPFSAAIWFNLNTVTKNWHSLIDAYGGSGSSRNFQLWMNSDSKIYVYHNDEQASITSTFSANVWYNVAYSYNGTGTGTVYVNGSSVGTIAVPTGSPSSRQIFVGARTDLNSSSFASGIIGQVSMWDLALSSSEVSQYYNALKTIYT